MLDTGTLKGRSLIDQLFVERLKGLFEDQEDSFFLDELADTRMKRDVWKKHLRRELTFLLSWAIERYLSTNSRKREQTSVPERVLSLLPRNAIATHVMRRAIPFAALGIPTEVSLHPESPKNSINVVRTIGRKLGLNKILTCSDDSSYTKVAQFQSSPNNLIVVTGREQSVKSIKQNSVCQVIGATGKCTIGLAETKEHAQQLFQALSKHNYPNSCTRLKGIFLGNIHSDSWVSISKSCTNKCRKYQPYLVLQKLHPSVILNNNAQQENPFSLEGYTVLTCNYSGQTDSLRGFARDPRWGWPGDFYI